MHSCIYTKDKKKKTKCWQEGFFKYKNGKILLYDSDKKLICTKATALTEDVDTFKYLIYIEDINNINLEGSENRLDKKVVDHECDDKVIDHECDGKVIDYEGDGKIVNKDDLIYNEEKEKINQGMTSINDCETKDEDINKKSSTKKMCSKNIFQRSKSEILNIFKNTN